VKLYRDFLELVCISTQSSDLLVQFLADDSGTFSIFSGTDFAPLALGKA